MVVELTASPCTFPGGTVGTDAEEGGSGEGAPNKQGEKQETVAMRLGWKSKVKSLCEQSGPDLQREIPL